MTFFLLFPELVSEILIVNFVEILVDNKVSLHSPVTDKWHSVGEK